MLYFAAWWGIGIATFTSICIYGWYSGDDLTWEELYLYVELSFLGPFILAIAIAYVFITHFNMNGNKVAVRGKARN